MEAATGGTSGAAFVFRSLHVLMEAALAKGLAKKLPPKRFQQDLK
jgi:pyrroline-5-carboxylate reductase